jgi:hypothetical protein
VNVPDSVRRGNGFQAGRYLLVPISGLFVNEEGILRQSVIFADSARDYDAEGIDESDAIRFERAREVDTP